jgi:putrescine aminotransferase
MHAMGGLPIPDIVHIDQPYWFGEGGDQDREAFGLERARQLEAKILELGPDRVAAFIGEPVQGAAGVFIPPDSYWPEVRRICSKYDVLLVADEVITGFGRTGPWFASEHFGIQPDVMTLAKGITSGYIPLGAVLFNDRIAGVLAELGGELAHGYTYGGHPVCTAVALENIRILEEEGIVARAQADTGPYLRDKWLALGEHPLVGEARILGMVGALELVPRKPSRQYFPDRGAVGGLCRDFALKNGLILRATNDAMLLSPPLVISRREIDELAEKAWAALDQTAAALGMPRAA